MTPECLVWDLDGTLTRPGTAVAAPGVPDVLRRWSGRGTPMAVATSYPTPRARAIVAGLGWAEVFSHVAGSLSGPAGKDDAVAEALLGLGRPLPGGAEGAVLIGDSASDMALAEHLGLRAVGVGWGSGTAAALREAGAVVVVTDPAELDPDTLTA